MHWILMVFLLGGALLAALFVLSACAVSATADRELETSMLTIDGRGRDSAERPNSFS